MEKIEPVAWACKEYIYWVQQRSLTDNSVLPNQSPLYSKATVDQLVRERDEWKQEALDHCEKVVKQANATLSDRHYMRLADEKLAATDALCQKYKEEIERMKNDKRD